MKMSSSHLVLGELAAALPSSVKNRFAPGWEAGETDLGFRT